MHREQKRGFGIVIVQVLTLPLGVGAVLAAAVSVEAALVGFGLSSLAIYRWWRPAPERAVFHVEAGRLRVRIGHSKTPQVDISLSDLVNVVLDTKTVQSALEGDSAIPAMRVIDAKPGFEIDEARIALVFADGRRQLLTTSYLQHTETTEAFGKLRVFLRKHNWLPEDERASVDSA